VLETWDWYINRFYDEPLLDILRQQALVRPEDRPRPLQGFGIGELAAKLNRSGPSVHKSIERLRAKDKVEFYFGGFRLKE
jgi:hypothetical protein